VWWGENVWERRQPTQSQSDAMSSFPRKPPNEGEKNTPLLPRDDAYIH